MAARGRSTRATPSDLKPFGHAVWRGLEVWDSYWVPVYLDDRRQTSQRTNLLYAVDLARGSDVYAVDVSGTARGAIVWSFAPTGRGWIPRVLCSVGWAPWARVIALAVPRSAVSWPAPDGASPGP